MNEFFATSADVYRLTGELNPAHDLHPAADDAPKDADATRQRLARMIGLDRRDGSPEDWLDLARSWRTRQVRVLAGEMRRVLEAHGLARDAVVVSAGCGDFLVRDVVACAAEGAAEPWRPRVISYGRDIAPARTEPGAGRAMVQDWAQVCAPCVAVATLFDMERSACGSSRSAAA